MVLRTFKDRAWGKATSFGMHPNTWQKLFDAVNPGAVVVANPICCQGGILLAALTYNDQKLAITQCPLFAFCKAENKEGRGTISKMNHMHHHNIAMVTVHYNNFFCDGKVHAKKGPCP